MSSKRIDLTQFEHDSNNPPEEIECAECGRTIESESGDNFFACHRCGWSGYPSDSQAILMVDGLIAELKRCYALLDKIAEQAIPDNEDPELYGYVINYELIKAITEPSEEE